MSSLHVFMYLEHHCTMHIPGKALMSALEMGAFLFQAWCILVHSRTILGI